MPKTIDNDLSATDYTFGFDTAVNIAMEAIDRLHTTADSHHRVLIVEVMGRHAGWIAFHAGLAGGANVILIPERPFDLERVCELVGRRFEAQFAPIVVVAEGAQPQGGIPAELDAGKDAFGHVRLGGIAHWLEGEIERRTGKETRATVLGHVQRGGTPTAFDRVLATRFGLHAIDAADAGDWGTMTALRGTEIELVDAERGDRGAEDGAGVALRRGGGLLWVGGGGAGTPSQDERPEAALECLGRGHPTLPRAAHSGPRSCGARRLRRRLRRRRGRDRHRLRRRGALRRGQARAGAGGGRGRLGPGPRRLRRRRSRRAAGWTWPRPAPTPAARPRTRPRSPTSKPPAPRSRFTRPILDEADIAPDRQRRLWGADGHGRTAPATRESRANRAGDGESSPREQPRAAVRELPCPRAGPRSASSSSVKRNS